MSDTAFNVSILGGGVELGDTRVYISGRDGFVLDFLGIPTKISYNAPNAEDAENANKKARAEIADILKPVSTEHGVSTYNAVQAGFLSSGFKEAPANVKLSEELVKESAELIEHFTVMMKSHLLAYAAQYIDNEKAYQQGIVDSARSLHDSNLKDPTAYLKSIEDKE